MVVLASGVVTKSGKGMFAAVCADIDFGRCCHVDGIIQLHKLSFGSQYSARLELSVDFNTLVPKYAALVSRQFVDMSRVRIEGLLAAFPKLVSTDTQHTYVETDNVRYLYQPMESMYLVLVTNKSSNILEDLETLRLLGKVITEFVLPLEEDYVAAAAFDLIFAFDEVVTLGGHKENVTSIQVKQNIEMESHEEKLHKMIIQSKINETKDLMKKKAMEIERQRLDGGKGGRSGMGYSGGISAGGMGNTGMNMPSQPSTFDVPDTTSMFASSTRDSTSRSGGTIRKGMKLGGKAGGASMLASLKAEGESVEDIVGSAAAAAAPVEMPKEPVFVTVEEKISVVLNKDGGVEGMEVAGSMSLLVNGEGDSQCVKVLLDGAPSSGYQFKTHPNIDKNLYSSENILGLKDPTRPFPTGAPLGVLKWRYQSMDESDIPLTINCWPSVSGGQSYVNIEYECTAPFDLHDVQIVVPVPALAAPPQVNQIDGDYQYDARKSVWTWKIELLDQDNSSGSAEFVVPAADPSIFFPINVSFRAKKTLCNLNIGQVVGATTGEEIKYGMKQSLVTESYVIE